MDVKYTSAGDNDVRHPLVTDRNRSAHVQSAFELTETCLHIKEEETTCQPNALVELDARTRALIRPYMTIDTFVKEKNGATILLDRSLLLDSGSLDGSYIGAGTLREYPNIIRQERETNTTVYMADKQTRLPISKKVYLDLTIETPGRDSCNFTGWFSVLNQEEERHD